MTYPFWTTLPVAFLWVLFAAEANGQSTKLLPTESLNIKLKSLESSTNKVAGDLDREITNPKLRAESGSKSKFSGSASLTYRGGGLSRPFGSARPDLSGLPENQRETGVDGGLKVRYRTNKNSSAILGVGLGVRTPLQGDLNATTNQVNVGDPLLGYNLTWAGLGLQNSANVFATFGTSKESSKLDQFGSGAIEYSVIKAFPQSRLHIGLSTYIYQNIFENRPGENPLTALPPGRNEVDVRTQTGLSLSPTIEYYLSDRVALRTLFSYFRWRHLYGHRDPWALSKIKEFQSVGVGWAVTRDVYLYPNVQFLPREIRADFTNVGLSATLNVF